MNMNMIVETGIGKDFNRINLDINNDISICIFLELSVFEEDFVEYFNINKAFYLENIEDGNIYNYVKKIIDEYKNFIIRGGSVFISRGVDSNIDNTFDNLVDNNFKIILNNVELEKCNTVENPVCIEIKFENFYEIQEEGIIIC